MSVGSWHSWKRWKGWQTRKYALAASWPFDLSKIFADGSKEGNLLECLVSVAIAAALLGVETDLAETGTD